MEYYKNLSLEDIVANIDGIGEVKEEWRDIKGWEGLYKISNFGRLKSLENEVFRKNAHGGITRFLYKEKIKKQEVCFGYLSIALTRGQKIYRQFAHRIVAEAFIPNPNNKPLINHKTGKRKFNFIGELEWSTNSENCLHAIDFGLNKNHGEKHRNTNFSEKDVLYIRCHRSNKTKSVIQLSKEFSVYESTIRRIEKGISWKHFKDDKNSTQ